MCPPALIAAAPLVVTSITSALGSIGLGTAAAGAAAGAAGAGGAAASAAGIAGSLGQILQIGGLLAGTVGAITGGNQQAALARRNADIARDQAREAQQIGLRREERSRQDFREASALQTAQLAASGVRLDSPSALQIGMETAMEAEREAHAIRFESGSQVAGYRDEAAIYEAQGRNARQRGYLGGAAKVLTAAPQIWPGLLS